MDQFDIIIIGAGAAGLMLCRAIAEEPFFEGKKILLLDKGPKASNDRTWCFWEKGSGEFDPILSHSWPMMEFKGRGFSRDFTLDPYRYKMVEGGDFYHAYLGVLSNTDAVTIKFEAVIEIKPDHSIVAVQTNKARYTAPLAFNSILDPGPMYAQTKFPVLQQHFKGWFIKTLKPVFNPEKALFMDFSIPQQGNTRFMYVLPTSTTEALVEYTLFSKNLLEEKAYDTALGRYLEEHLRGGEYEVIRTEKGSIPMTVYDFTKNNTGNLLYIGTAGGWTKASTGYTFKNTQKRVKDLVSFLKENKPLNEFPARGRHRWYDLLLLDILYRDNHFGQQIFEALFRKRTAQEIFKFLDEESGLGDDIKIIWACPKWPFLKALLRRIFKNSYPSTPGRNF